MAVGEQVWSITNMAVSGEQVLALTCNISRQPNLKVVTRRGIEIIKYIKFGTSMIHNSSIVNNNHTPIGLEIP